MKFFAMAKTITSNLAQGPATLMYPQRPRQYTPITRGRIDNAIDKCIFCGLCSRRCPTYAITVSKEKREWDIDRLKCCICNLCTEVCPVKCLSTGDHYSAAVTVREAALHRETAPPVAEPEHPTPRGEA